MKPLNLIIFLVLALAIISFGAYFYISGRESNSKEYLKKAGKYEETGDRLKKITNKIDDQVKQKQTYLNKELLKLDASIKELEKNKAENKELIDAAKKSQEQLLDNYCKDMEELGQTNIEQCNNRK